ncbi:MAG: type II toxin-antitoxin system RelB/DinJ family antitoxin [Firmicutes bacterium]|nr:type II toxin-antitoxin system RelB/DinJ family antitoxin [Bacillota bacterium]
MAKTATIHARIDEQIKSDAIKVFDEIGISTADAITLFFRQVALKNGIPFEITADRSINTVKQYWSNLLNRINHYKRDDLEKVLNVIPESVDELWVFGSAVTPYCRPDSDLDVCIVGDNITKEDRKVLAHAPRRGMDLLNISHADFEKERQDPNSVYYDVFHKGVRVYGKGDE